MSVGPNSASRTSTQDTLKCGLLPKLRGTHEHCIQEYHPQACRKMLLRALIPNHNVKCSRQPLVMPRPQQRLLCRTEAPASNDVQDGYDC